MCLGYRTASLLYHEDTEPMAVTTVTGSGLLGTSGGRAASARLLAAGGQRVVAGLGKDVQVRPGDAHVNLAVGGARRSARGVADGVLVAGLASEFRISRFEGALRKVG